MDTTICGNDRTYEVTEFCPHCEREITMTWDTDTDGFKAFCPHCGKRLMLCDECRHCTNAPAFCDYDSKTDGCQFNPPAKKGVVKSSVPFQHEGYSGLPIIRDLSDGTRLQDIFVQTHNKTEVYSLHVKNNEVIVTDSSDYTKIYAIYSKDYFCQTILDLQK